MIWIIGSRGIPARYGGFETLAEHLQRGLTGRGLDVRVIGTRDAATARTLAARMIRGSRLWALETPLLTWTTRPLVRPGDSVLVLNPVNVWTARWLERRCGHVLLHLDGMEDRRAKWGPVARAVHRLARRSAVRSNLVLIADHPEIQRIYRDEFGRDTELIAYGGCDTAETDPTHRWSPERAADHFVVMARPEPENQVLEICKAFAASPANARLLVVGGPSRPTDYWRQIKSTAAQDPRIELLGPVWDRERLCSLMMTARAYIHGHTVGGTNPSLVDVLSHGTPVLAHENVFNRSVVGSDASMWTSEADLTSLLNECQTRPPATSARVNRETTWAVTTSTYRALLQLEDPQSRLSP